MGGPGSHAEVEDGSDIGSFDEFFEVEGFQRSAGQSPDDLIAVREEFVEVDGEEAGIGFGEEGGFVEEAMAESAGTCSKVFQDAGGPETDEGAVFDDLIEVGPPKTDIERTGEGFDAHAIEIDFGDAVMRFFFEAEFEKEFPEEVFATEAGVAGDFEEVALDSLC